MIIDIRKVFSYFKERWTIKRSTNGWYSMECPFGCRGSAGKQKFCVSMEKKFVKCWRCEYRCPVEEFVADIEPCELYDAKQLLLRQSINGSVDAELLQTIKYIKESSVSLPHGYKSLMDGTGTLAERARKYLTDRRFDIEKLDRRGFGYCDERHPDDPKQDYFGYIIMPFKRNGSLRYYIGRDFLGGQYLRYKNPGTEVYGIGKAALVYNEDALQLYDDVFVFEGIWDAETMGDNAIASQGWSLSDTQRDTIMRAGMKRLIFCPDKNSEDNPADFYSLAVKTASKFLDIVPEVYVVKADNIKGKGKDCNELGRNAYLEEYHKTQQLTDSMVIDILG